jgi:hypothetical protein
MRLLLNQEAVSVKDCMKEFATLVAFHRPGAQKLSPEKSSFIKTMIVVMMLAVLLITTASPVLANAPSELSSAATTLKFTAVADAQVTRKYPNRNYGTSAELGVAGGSGAASSAYIRFDVSNISGVVKNAVLRIYCKSPRTKNRPAFYLVVDNNWIEYGRGGITWKRQPALSGEAYDNKAVISRRSWVQYNVTGLVNGNGTYTFALVADSIDSVKFSSR